MFRYIFRSTPINVLMNFFDFYHKNLDFNVKNQVCQFFFFLRFFMQKVNNVSLQHKKPVNSCRKYWKTYIVYSYTL